MFRSVIVEAKVREDEELAKELASQVSDAESVSAIGKAVAHGSVVEVLCMSIQ